MGPRVGFIMVAKIKPLSFLEIKPSPWGICWQGLYGVSQSVQPNARIIMTTQTAIKERCRLIS
jgi:hypothetical protein